MACEVTTLPGGAKAIICSPSRRCACGRSAPLLCDWKVPTRRSGTCDAAICARCAVSPTTDKHLCPTHAQAFKVWSARRADPEART